MISIRFRQSSISHRFLATIGVPFDREALTLFVRKLQVQKLNFSTRYFSFFVLKTSSLDVCLGF
jgi:hypothetical protein